MKKLPGIFTKQQGMTLIEVIVTLGVLSFVLIGTLTIYSETCTTIRTRDNLINMLHDADLIMSYIGEDIRNAAEILKDYQVSDPQAVMAAIKVKQETLNQTEERVIVYALDPQQPNRLIRSVRMGERSTSLELSTLVQKLEIIPRTERVFEVQLILENPVAGKVNTWRTSSAFALR
jgi:prepilin-type N-terminal cleavage/methylation domain-containing protein